MDDNVTLTLILTLPLLLPLPIHLHAINHASGERYADRPAPVQLRRAAAAEPNRANRLHGAHLQRDGISLPEVHALVSLTRKTCALECPPR